MSAGVDAGVADDGFTDFVTARVAAMSRVAYLLTGDHHLAEDLVQSAFAKAYRHWQRIRTGHPEAYIRRTMYHEQVSRWRRHRNREQLQATPPDTITGPGYADPADGVSLRLALARILNQLTARQRAVIVLRYYEDLSEAQTAEVLGCSVGTVKRQGHTAMARLRAIAPQLLDGDADNPGRMALHPELTP